MTDNVTSSGATMRQATGGVVSHGGFLMPSNREPDSMRAAYDNGLNTIYVGNEAATFAVCPCKGTDKNCELCGGTGTIWIAARDL